MTPFVPIRSWTRDEFESNVILPAHCRSQRLHVYANMSLVIGPAPESAGRDPTPTYRI